MFTDYYTIVREVTGIVIHSFIPLQELLHQGHIGSHCGLDNMYTHINMMKHDTHMHSHVEAIFHSQSSYHHVLESGRKLGMSEDTDMEHKENTDIIRAQD